MTDQPRPVPPAPDQNPSASTPAPPPPPPPPAGAPTSAAPPPGSSRAQPHEQTQHNAYSYPPQPGHPQPQAQHVPQGYGHHAYAPQSDQSFGFYPQEPKKKGWVLPTLIAGIVVLVGAIVAVVFLFILPGSDESDDAQAQNETSSSPAPSDESEDAPGDDSNSEEAPTTEPDETEPDLDETDPGATDGPDAETTAPDSPPADIDPPNLPEGFPKPSDFNRKQVGDGYEFDPSDPKLEGSDDLGELFDEFRDKYATMNDDESLWEIIEPTPQNKGAYVAFQFILTDMRSALRFGPSPEVETYYAHQAKYLESLLLAEQPLGSSISIELENGDLFSYDGETGITTIE